MLLKQKIVREMEKVDNICLKKIEVISVSLEESNKEKERLSIINEELEGRYSNIMLKSQLLENEKLSCQKILDSMILKQAEDAFISYMNEQSTTFNNIAKTYGKNV